MKIISYKLTKGGINPTYEIQLSENINSLSEYHLVKNKK